MNWRRACVLAGVSLLAACGAVPVGSGTYTVRRGDTLYSIAQRTGSDVRQLARLNRLDSAFRIYPGQVLRLSSGVVAPRASTAAPSAENPRRPASAPPKDIQWRWPTGPASYSATTRPNGGIGLLFSGQAGQDITAAAAGRVVYTGSGLLGYGQLIIIKHDEVFLSAYGHVENVQVREGDAVALGQKLAGMGKDSAGAPTLYFEIRVNGQPTDPLPLLQGQR